MYCCIGALVLTDSLASPAIAICNAVDTAAIIVDLKKVPRSTEWIFEVVAHCFSVTFSRGILFSVILSPRHLRCSLFFGE